MDLVTPSIGLIIWQTLIFVLLLWVLKKVAWKPILAIIHKREETIKESLALALKNKEDIKVIQTQREQLIKEVQLEKQKVLHQAQLIAEQIQEKAYKEAQEQTYCMIEKAKEEIEIQKSAALASLKNELAELSIHIAEKLLENHLEENDKQHAFIEKLIKEIPI